MSPTKPDAKKAAVETPIAPEAVKAEPVSTMTSNDLGVGLPTHTSAEK